MSKDLPEKTKCKYCELPSIVGGKTIFGFWANLCEVHYAYGVALGLWIDQLLEKGDKRNEQGTH